MAPTTGAAGRCQYRIFIDTAIFVRDAHGKLSQLRARKLVNLVRANPNEVRVNFNSLQFLVLFASVGICGIDLTGLQHARPSAVDASWRIQLDI